MKTQKDDNLWWLSLSPVIHVLQTTAASVSVSGVALLLLLVN